MTEKEWENELKSIKSDLKDLLSSIEKLEASLSDEPKKVKKSNSFTRFFQKLIAD